MEARAVAKSVLLASPLSPLHTLPERLAVEFGCSELPLLLGLMDSYVREYGSYWLAALRDDAERSVEEIDEKAEELKESLECALNALEKSPTLATIELMDIIALSMVPKVVGPKHLRKVSLELSVAVHVGRRIKKGLKEVTKCWRAMSGAVLGER